MTSSPKSSFHSSKPLLLVGTGRRSQEVLVMHGLKAPLQARNRMLTTSIS
jgi:hypothetical protein